MNSENLLSTHVPQLPALQFTFQSVLSIYKYVVVSFNIYLHLYVYSYMHICICGYVILLDMLIPYMGCWKIYLKHY